MAKRALQRMGIVMLLCAGLAAAPAAAVERPGMAVARGEEVLAAARLWLSSVLAGWRNAPGASAGGWSAASGEAGQIMDPNGFRVADPPPVSPEDEGSGRAREDPDE